MYKTKINKKFNPSNSNYMKYLPGITLLLLMSLSILPIISFAQSSSLDLSFGSNGIATCHSSSVALISSSMVIQSDGKIIVAGSSWTSANVNSIALARFNNSGILDSSFGNNGIVITHIGYSNVGISVAIQTDGKILVSGYVTNSSIIDENFSLVRYNSSGNLDSTFGTNGIIMTDFGTLYDCGYSIFMQSDGKIIVAGQGSNFSTYDFAMARYKNNGSLDSTFGLNGKIITDLLGYNDFAKSVYIQNDGKILIAGHSNNGTLYPFSLVRYTNSGMIDSTFDGDGIVITQIANTNYNGIVTVQNDGKILLAGQVGNTLTPGFIGGLIRYNINGGIDSTFDNDGIVTTAIGNDFRIESITLQNNGKIIVAGYIKDTFNILHIALVRYGSNGILDSTFDSDGIVITSSGSSANYYGKAVALQNDGKILVAGDSNDTDFLVARYTEDNSTQIQDPTSTSLITFSPNPFINSVVLNSNTNLKNAVVTIYDLTGRLVEQIDNINGQTITLQLNILPAGIFIAQLKENNKTLFIEKLLIKVIN